MQKDAHWPKWTARALAVGMALVVGVLMTQHYRAVANEGADAGNLLPTQAALGTFVMRTEDARVFLATVLYVEPDAVRVVEDDLVQYTRAIPGASTPVENVSCQVSACPSPRAGADVLIEDLRGATDRLSASAIVQADKTSHAVLHFRNGATAYIAYTRGDASPSALGRADVPTVLGPISERLLAACGEGCPARYVNLTIVGEWSWDLWAYMDLDPPPGRNVVGPFAWTATAKPGDVPVDVAGVLEPLAPVQATVSAHTIFVPIVIVVFAALAVALSFAVDIAAPYVRRNAQPFLPVPLLALVLVVFLVVTADHGVSVGPAWAWILGPFALFVIAVIAIYVAFPYFATLDTASTIWGVAALAFTLNHLVWAIRNVEILDPLEAVGILYDGGVQGRVGAALGSAGTMMSYFLWWGGAALLAWEAALFLLTLAKVRAVRRRRGGALSFLDAARAVAGPPRSVKPTPEQEKDRSRVPEVRLWAMRIELADAKLKSLVALARKSRAADAMEPSPWSKIEDEFKSTLKETRGVL